MDHLTDAVRQMDGKADTCRYAWDYYEGRHPLVFSTDKLSKVFDKHRLRFVENWIGVVVDAVTDRLQLNGFTVTGEGDKVGKVESERLGRIFDSDDWGSLASEVHTSVVVTGEAFVILQTGEGGSPEAYCQDSSNCAAVYDLDRPRRMLCAAKRYLDSTGRVPVWRAILYYPDRLERYEQKNKRWVMTGDPEGNPLGFIPVVHFRFNRRSPAPDFVKVIPLQDAINKQFSDLMVTADVSAFPLRWLISSSDVDIPPIKPGDILQIPGGAGDEQATSTGTYATSDLEAYVSSKADLAHSMASISRTPRHYFTSAAGIPSGEALQAMEAPLVKKVRTYMDRMDGSWAELCVMALAVEGITIEASSVESIWEDPRTVQSLSLAQSRRTNVDAGIPIVTLLRDEGWRESELEQLQKDIQMAKGPAEGMPSTPEAEDVLQSMVAASIAPLVEQTVQMIGDVALAKLLEGDRLDRIMATRAAEAAGNG